MLSRALSAIFSFMLLAAAWVGLSASAFAQFISTPPFTNFMDTSGVNALLPAARINLFPTPTVNNCIVGTGTDWVSGACGVGSGMATNGSNALPPALDAIATAAGNKLSGQLSTTIPGTVGNGIADDSAKFIAYLATQPAAGGRIVLGRGNTYYLASSITIPTGTVLDCNRPRNQTAIFLAAGATITLSDAATLQNCGINPYGATFPVATSAAYAGTAITLGAGGDQVVKNVLMIGFAKCIDGTGVRTDRLRLEDVDCDSLAGEVIGTSYDTSFFSNLRNWPWGTAGCVGTGCNLRSGKGLDFEPGSTGRIDDLKVFGFLDYGHSTGIYFATGNDCCDIHMDNVWLDNDTTPIDNETGGEITFGKTWVWTATNPVTFGASAFSRFTDLYINTSAHDCIQIAEGANVSWGRLRAVNCSGATVRGTVDAAGWDAYNPNLLLNPSFDLDQPNEGVPYTATGSQLAMDGWDYTFTSAASGITFTQAAAGAPNGATYTGLVTIGTGSATVGASDQVTVRSLIPAADFTAAAFGTADAKPITISANVNCSVTGGYSFSFHNGANNRAWVEQVGLTGGVWTPLAFSILGDTTGTWTGNPFMEFAMEAGSTLQTASLGSWLGSGVLAGTGQTQASTTTGATCAITQAKVEIGSPTRVVRSNLAAIIARAQAYYEKSYDIGVAPAAITDNGEALLTMQTTSSFTPISTERFRATKACTPTVTLFSPSTGTSGDIDEGGVGAAAGTVTHPAKDGFEWGPTVAWAPGAVGYTMQTQWTADCRL